MTHNLLVYMHTIIIIIIITIIEQTLTTDPALRPNLIKREGRGSG